MKHIPILFSTPMVQAILEGRKTMTRRVVKYPQKCPTHHISIGESDAGPMIDWAKWQPGDVLWVRETSYQSYKGDKYFYKTDFITDPVSWNWKPSIFMPKEACRIFLEVTNVRAERLFDISEQDAINEGIESFRPVPGDGPAETQYKHYLKNKWGSSPIHSFETLWHKINGDESWNANPWVWVIEFKRIEKPENF